MPGDRVAERPRHPATTTARPEEQGLAACEQGPHRVVFTVAKFRPPGPASTVPTSRLLPGFPGSASCAY